MRLDSRIGWLLLGAIIGFVIGYVVRSLRDIREKVTEVDEIVKKSDKKDGGFFSIEGIKNLALFLVVVLTVYSSIKSQQSSDKVADAQDSVSKTQSSQAKSQSCTQMILIKTVAALNARTEFSQDQAAANRDLQKSQASFIGLFVSQTPVNSTDAAKALNTYFTAITTFITVSGKTSNSIANNPYPTPTEFSDCLKRK